MARTVPLFLLVTTNIIGSILAQTPVIGGSCKLGTADVQIGGKQTQFFLKCESTAESVEGEGVWVVKSRSASASSSGSSSAAVPSENTQLHQRPPSSKSLNSSPNICGLCLYICISLIL
ncbi:hypothetical protein WR25_25566 [Diploscapter pachys]|uniref:Uncharacterized protein n=1 Tax=Diploscapter pachys TaxID=2018661 RepID=A0A2A2LZB1_9BILA|nr:hypothetical protein WR25_25566 [Diploscapter pachys]